MSNNQSNAIELMIKFIPKKFGIKEAYYRESKNKIECIFIVSEKNASRLISYLNSLSAIIEKEIKGVDIETNIYIDDRQKKISNIKRDEGLEKMKLINRCVGVCA